MAREVIVMIVLVEVVMAVAMAVAEELVSGMGPTTASFLVWDRLSTHSCVSGGSRRRWCMFPVLRIVNETSN